MGALGFDDEPAAPADDRRDVVRRCHEGGALRRYLLRARAEARPALPAQATRPVARAAPDPRAARPCACGWLADVHGLISSVRPFRRRLPPRASRALLSPERLALAVSSAHDPARRRPRARRRRATPPADGGQRAAEGAGDLRRAAAREHRAPRRRDNGTPHRRGPRRRSYQPAPEFAIDSNSLRDAQRPGFVAARLLLCVCLCAG
jgi:hypothetical protein